MVFKKVLTSEGQPVIIRTSNKSENKFPPGFSYCVGGIIYTVKKDVTQDVTASMREVSLSDGKTEIMPVESIEKDLKEHDCQILPIDTRFVKKEAVKEVVKEDANKNIIKKKVKKVAKKKVAKKNE